MYLGRWEIATEPTEEPVTTAEFKDHSRIYTSDDDTLIGSYITAARREIEKRLGMALVTQTWDLYLDYFPAVIIPPKPPLVSVTHIKYTDTDGTETTIDSGDYLIDAVSVPGRIVPAYGVSWPGASLYPVNPINVRFVCGYGAASAVPEEYKLAVKFLAAHWYEHREPIVSQPGIVSTEIGETLNRIIILDKVWH